MASHSHVAAGGLAGAVTHTPIAAATERNCRPSPFSTARTSMPNTSGLHTPHGANLHIDCQVLRLTPPNDNSERLARNGGLAINPKTEGSMVNSCFIGG
jgi:hypothetical protein